MAQGDTNQRRHPFFRRHLTFFSVAILVVAADQITKALVRFYLLHGQSFPAQGLLRITHITNSGAAFGILSNQSPLLMVTAGIGIIALLLYYRFPFFDGALTRVGLGLQLGGAAGNLMDRLQLGHVTDFIDLRVWPVFNLADSAIVLGVIILGYFLVTSKREEDADSVGEPGPRLGLRGDGDR